MSFSACTEKSGHGDSDGGDKEFDIRGEKEFWDEMKRGLVLELYFCSMSEHVYGAVASFSFTLVLVRLTRKVF